MQVYYSLIINSTKCILNKKLDVMASTNKLAWSPPVYFKNIHAYHNLINIVILSISVTLGSDVVNTLIWRSSESCSSGNNSQSTNVKITFEHSSEVKVREKESQLFSKSTFIYVFKCNRVH